MPSLRRAPGIAGEAVALGSLRGPASGCARRRLAKWNAQVSTRGERSMIDNASLKLDDLPLPKGDFGLPILGSALEYYDNKHDFTIGRVKRYGPVSKTQILGKPFVIVAGDHLLQKVFYEDPDLLKQGIVRNFKELFGQESMINIDGEQHTHLRNTIGPLFTKSASETYIPRIAKLADEYCQEWAGKGSIVFEKESTEFGFSAVAKSVLGMQFPINGNSISDVLEALTTFNSGMYSFGINLPFTKFGKAMAARRFLLSIIESQIQMMRRDPSLQGGLRDLIDSADKKSSRLNSKHLRDNVLTLLFAGFGTTTSAACMTMLELARHPEVWDKVKQEQERIVAKYGPAMSEDAVGEMAYTEAVVNEAMRVLPQAAATYKTATKTFELNGYRIPAGWGVITAVGTTAQYLDSRWPGDVDFNPDRYLSEAGTKRASTLVFGMGPHICLGRILAVIQNKILLATLARNYDMETSDVNQPVVSRPFPRVVNGLNMKIKKIKG